MPIALRVATHLRSSERELRDQLRRAALSIPLDIAEGAGKTTAADRARFHAIARGSAMECAAILDICLICGTATEEDHDLGKQLLTKIVSILTRMCR